MDAYNVIFEDDQILVVNKISPLPVLPDKSKDPDLKHILMQEGHANKGFLEAAHRIDRRTSGLVLFAKTQAALKKLEEDFRNRGVEKTYLACLEREPVPPEGILRHFIRIDPRTNRSAALPWQPTSAKAPAGAASAELSYRSILATDRYFFVEAKPLTGRHHQIRAQFSAMGWPIKGDLKYGAKRSSASGRIMLHAWRVKFSHPVTTEILELEAALPSDETLWNVLRLHLEPESPSTIA